MVCDEKRGTLRRKEGDANEKQALKGRMNRGRPKRRWLDKVKDGIKEKRLSAVMMCLTVLHGGVCHRTNFRPHIKVGIR